jgi:hypothetical protein
MNSITKTLLGGVAFGALATAPAIAGGINVPPFHVTALYAGKAVNKTKVHNPPHQCRYSTCITDSVSTYVPASDLDKKVNLIYTFYKFDSNSTLCSQPREKIKVVPKKTQYAKVGAATATYSEGCASGPTTFYGDNYKLTNPAGEGQTDSFVSTLIGKIKYNGRTYMERLNLDVSVKIGG